MGSYGVCCMHQSLVIRVKRGATRGGKARLIVCFKVIE